MAKISLGTIELDSSQPAVILGAPGAGKTTALIELVAKFEAEGLAPDQIVVLTPSRLAANKLRDQIAVGSKAAAANPRARSIASYAFWLLSRENPTLKLLSGAAQQALIAELIGTAVAKGQQLAWGIDALTCELQGFQTEVRDLMAVVIENQLDAQALTVIQQKFPKTKLRVATDLLPSYREALRAQNALDPSELLVAALEILEDQPAPEVLIVDDVQDLSPAAISLVGKLSKRAKTFVFGDPDAAVMGFRSLAESFLSTFGDLTRVFLPAPKATAQKLWLMQQVANRIPTALATAQRPRGNSEAAIKAQLFENQSAEADWLAANLRRANLIDHVSFDEMAVVARTRTQLDQLASDLSARSIPVRIVGVQQALIQQPAARAILDFGALVYDLPMQVDHEQLLLSPLAGLDALGVRRLYREISQLDENRTLSNSQLKLEIFDQLIESESFEIRALNRIIESRFRISNLGEISAHEFVSEVAKLMNLERLRTLSRSNSPVALSASRDLDALLELFAAAMRFDLREKASAKDFVAHQLSLVIPEDSLAPIGLREAVTLTTSAQLIGASYEIVALPRLQEGIWPNLKPRSSWLGASSLQSYLLGRTASPEEAAGNELADELRSFYKAVGAHRSQLLLSAMSAQDEQPSQFFTMFSIPTELNELEIDFDIRRQVGRLRKKALQSDQEAIAILAALSTSGTPGAHPRNWQGLISISSTEPVVNPGEALRLSASKLEAFEKCPLHWFIGSFGGETGNFQASLGTLLHAALEASAQGEELTDFVKSNWHTMEFESNWHELQQLRRSAKMIALMTQYLNQANQLVAAERPFEIKIGNLTVSGKIDRIESTEDGLLVVDLKTGKPPTEKDVQQNRQLALYQLALTHAGESVAGAKIVSVGGDSLKVLSQGQLEPSQQEEIGALLDRAANEIGSDQFAASISSHCSGDGSCQLLLAKAVQHG
jgi:superfamily I DNA/RNA helicase